MVSPVITLDPTTVEQMISQAVEDNISTAIQNLGQDPDWLEKIERQVNQAVVDQVVRQFGQIDLNPIIKERVDENMHLFQQDILKNFTSTGIVDQATTRQLTITDDDTVVENQLTSKNLNVAKVAIIEDLIVRGSVNIDNPSWVTLANGISEKTLDRLSSQ